MSSPATIELARKILPTQDVDPKARTEHTSEIALELGTLVSHVGLGVDPITESIALVSPYTSPNNRLPSNLINLYKDKLDDTALLTAAEEVELAQSIEAGETCKLSLVYNEHFPDYPDPLSDEEHEDVIRRGDEAYKRFVASNLKLVWWVASKFAKSTSVQFPDLVQEGNIGLMIAVKKFDWRRGFRFNTMAYNWIYQAVQQGVAKYNRTISLPPDVERSISKYRRASAQFRKSTGREPTLDELSAATGFAIEQIMELIRYDRPMIPMQKAELHDKGFRKIVELSRVLRAPNDTEVEAVNRALLTEIKARLDKYDAQAWRVLQLRYGLDDSIPQTLQAIGAQLGRSHQWASNMEKKALGIAEEYVNRDLA